MDIFGIIRFFLRRIDNRFNKRKKLQTSSLFIELNRREDMKVLINYANDLFRTSQQVNSTTGKTVGLFDEIISYSPKDIDSEFYAMNKTILSQKKGNGYWLWKPYFIKKTLEVLNDGDFLFYCDSGSYFLKPITPIINISLETGQDVIPFELMLMEKAWTKRDTFVLMDCDNPDFTDSNQRLGGFSLWRKSKFAMNVASEYLRFSQDPRIITDLENQFGYENYPEFKQHRHDQSIFSLLTKKYELQAYRDPSQWGNKSRHVYPQSKYDQLIELTRARDETIFQKILRKGSNAIKRFSK